MDWTYKHPCKNPRNLCLDGFLEKMSGYFKDSTFDALKKTCLDKAPEPSKSLTYIAASYYTTS